MNKELKAIQFQGIRPDSLGNYFVGLGLLAALSKKYPQIRGCWRDGHFVLLGKDLVRKDVEDYLLDEWQPTPYVRWWEKAYTDDRELAKKKKLGESLTKQRAQQLAGELRSLDSTVVSVERPILNPIFGDIAGKLGGQRDFSKVQRSCLQFLSLQRGETLQTESISKDLARYIRGFNKNPLKNALIYGWLVNTLFDKPCDDIPPIGSAGTWFVNAKESFNSGQDWSREGEISPWSFLLALEGASLFVGGVNRRLGSRSRAYAVFPFLSEAPPPKTEKEIGLIRAEIWSPVWSNPINLSELRALLERGLARIGNRAAKSPYEFALAARSAGVDIGVTSFSRFVLRQTTSSKAYEAIPCQRIEVSQTPNHESQLVTPLIPWIDSLPFEPRNDRQKTPFSGLRGPIEEGIIRLAANPDDTERWQKLWLMLADVQGKIDKNKTFRTNKNRALPWLDEAWFEKAWGENVPDEILVARAVASIGAGTNAPIIGNIFGVVEDKYKKVSFVGEQRPQKVVWHNGDLTDVFLALLQRRLVDAEKESETALPKLPFDFKRTCSPEVLTAFLNKSLDYQMIQKWIPAFSLVKWKHHLSDLAETSDIQDQYSATDGGYLLQALFRPLFYPFNLEFSGKELFPNHLKPRTIIARRLLNLLRQNSWDEAIQLAKSRYLPAGYGIVNHSAIEYSNGDLVASALLVPLSVEEIKKGLRRWLKPKKNSK